jgi:signal transduction histidine kinase
MLRKPRLLLRRLWRTTTGLVAIVGIVFAAAILAIGAISYEVTHEALEQQLDHRIAAETAGLLAEAHRHGLPAIAGAITRREASRSTASLEYLLVDQAGRRLAGSLQADVPAKPGFEEFLHYRKPGQDEVATAQALTTNVAGGTLVVAADRSGLDEIDRTLAILFAGALAAMLVVGALAAGIIGWLTQRRLSRIDATAQAIIGGDFTRRVPRDGSGSEFDRLAGTLNAMLDRIEGLMESLRQVSSDVAHDLRTPLTRLCGSLDQAAGEQDEALRSERLDSARAQAAELLEIFAALLRIAEIEGMNERLPRQRLDLTALLEKMAESYRPDFEDSGHILQCWIAPDLSVQGDHRLLSQVVANLLDNGLSHTPPGTTVELYARPTAGGVSVVVGDDGPGASQADRERLFNRFARGEQARSTAGHGLGLSMVKAIAEAHGGSVSILDVPGFAVELRLPRKS